MPTEYLNSPLSEYAIHKISTPESGGGIMYYLYIHSSGQAIIMKESEDKKDYTYANAGKGLEHWEDREDLHYTTFDRLAKMKYGRI